MIFAELEYQQRYDELHDELVSYVRSQFSQVQSGLQGDSWIWIFDGEEKVAIDTFSSMRHQVKSAKTGPHVRKVVDALARAYTVKVYEEPELEGHEDGPI